MIKFAPAVKAGDYVRIWAHKAQPRYRSMWWKVTAIEITRTGERLELVNRHGETGRWYGNHTKFNVWTPGEDNRDD